MRKNSTWNMFSQQVRLLRHEAALIALGWNPEVADCEKLQAMQQRLLQRGDVAFWAGRLEFELIPEVR